MARSSSNLARSGCVGQARDLVGGRLGLQGDQRQVVGHNVMHLPGDPGPLLERGAPGGLILEMALRLTTGAQTVAEHHSTGNRSDGQGPRSRPAAGPRTRRGSRRPRRSAPPPRRHIAGPGATRPHTAPSATRRNWRQATASPAVPAVIQPRGDGKAGRHHRLRGQRPSAGPHQRKGLHAGTATSTHGAPQA